MITEGLCRMKADPIFLKTVFRFFKKK